ncbi:MAG: aminopeptidase P family N-terminal domain-containing protein [Candidatus Aenigmatarchaeota archaeon]
MRELRTHLIKEKVDSAVFMCTESLFDPNIGYFTGLNLQRNSSFAVLNVTQINSVLAVTPLEYEQARKEADVDKLVNL